jgi:hypothetical protein
VTRSKKDFEKALLMAFLECLGENPETWVIEEEGERPDFVLRSATNARIGIEMTELLKTDQGKDRAADNRVAEMTRRVVSEYLRSVGGSGGAIIEGTTDRLPQSEAVELEETIQRHLAQHGKPLLKDRGVLDEPLSHPWGAIHFIERKDSLEGVMLLEVGYPSPLAYKTPRSTSDIESDLVEVIRRKSEKGRSYRPGIPLWLAIRNPNQPLRLVRSEIKQEIREANRGIFARLVIFNLQQDVLSNRPPTPPYLDLLE